MDDNKARILDLASDAVTGGHRLVNLLFNPVADGRP
jgi:hypothetical protein